jgi:phage shock protein E
MATVDSAADAPPLFPTPMPTFRQQPIDLVIDVRSKVEFWLGHLPGAICLPVQSIAESLPAMPDVAKDARILLVCASGARSAAAAEILGSLGYTRVVDGGATESARSEFVA